MLPMQDVTRFRLADAAKKCFSSAVHIRTVGKLVPRHGSYRRARWLAPACTSKLHARALCCQLFDFHRLEVHPHRLWVHPLQCLLARGGLKRD